MSGGWAGRWRGLPAGHDPDSARRLAQARAYCRSGRVSDARASNGLLSGRVQGTGATPRLVELALPVLSDDAWSTVAQVIAGQARYSARLLADLAPGGLDAELERHGVELFPRVEEIEVTCGCADRHTWCTHALAVWEAAAVLLDADPFVLLRLRGRGRERLLADLAAVRAGSAGQQAAPQAVPIAQLDVARWTRGGPLLRSLLVPPPSDPGAAPVLAALDDPPGWSGGVSPLDLIRPLIEGAAAWAAEVDRRSP